MKKTVKGLFAEQVEKEVWEAMRGMTVVQHPSNNKFIGITFAKTIECVLKLINELRKEYCKKCGWNCEFDCHSKYLLALDDLEKRLREEKKW